MSLFHAPKFAPQSGGTAYPSAKLYFYSTGTSAAATVYTDSALTTAHASPVVADAGGVFAPIYLSPTASYRVVLKTSGDATVWDVDPYPTLLGDAEDVGAVLWPRTDLEIAAAVTPSDYGYEPGDARRYGATGDGTSDDTAALTSLVSYANASSLTAKPVEIVLPPGTYLYTDTLWFTRPVHLSGHGATLKYSGSSAAVKLGADDIDNFDVFLQGEYTIDGVRFTGGSTATYGIYLNEYVIEPRILNCTFEDYGKSTTYDIYAQYENWNILIENCRKLTYSSTTAVGSFIAIVGTTSGGTSDAGNSRCTIRDCWMTAYDSQELGYFAYVNAMKCRIIGGGFQWSNGGILLGGLASSTLIDGVYAELSTTSTPNYISVYSADAGSGNYHHPQQVTVRNGYINMHQDDITNTGRMVATQDANVKLIDWRIEDMTIGNFASSQPLIVQNDATGQTGNRYARVRPIFVPSSSDDGTRFAMRGTYTSAEAWECYDLVGSTLTTTQLTANADNYNPTGLEIAGTLRMSSDASRDLTGIVGGFAGRRLVVCNVGAQNLVLKNDATSTAANRFLLGADVTLGPEESISLWYDATSSRWRATGRHN